MESMVRCSINDKVRYWEKAQAYVGFGGVTKSSSLLPCKWDSLLAP